MTEREEPFRVTVSAGDPGVTRIVVTGELDSGRAQELGSAYVEAVKRGELDADRHGAPARIALDLEGVDFMDSGGLRMLIAIEREAERQGVELSVLAPPDSVTELLELTGVAERVRLVREEGAPERDRDFLERMEVEFEADNEAPSRARAAVRESLGPVLSDSALATVVLMTSELVTNGVVHSTGGSRVGLRLTTFSDGVRIEVDDPGAGFDPTARPAAPDGFPAPDAGGRGLFVVDQCATRWGIRHADTDRGRRFSVWFEVETEAV